MDCTCNGRDVCLGCVLTDIAVEDFLAALTALEAGLPVDVWSFERMRWISPHNYKEDIYLKSGISLD